MQMCSAGWVIFHSSLSFKRSIPAEEQIGGKRLNTVATLFQVYLLCFFVFVSTGINALCMIVSYVIECLVSLNISVASETEFAAFPYASTLRALTSISSPLVTNTEASTTFTQRQSLSSLPFLNINV